jgi:small nuclear ribonucleoprotein (snRNP)-like protein
MCSRYCAWKVWAPVLIAGVAIACERTPPLEEMPAGTDVTIEMQDGRRVTGKLVNVDKETVVVAREPRSLSETAASPKRPATEAPKIEVTRSKIAEVQQTPEVREVELREAAVPAGTVLDAQLGTSLASDTSRVEQTVEATLTVPLLAEGVTVAAAGSTLVGTVTNVRESGRVRGRAEVEVQFSRLRTDAVTYDIRTEPLRWIAEATKGEDAVKVGVGAAAGAVIGAIAGGGKGAAVGSAIGAGGGSAVVLATKGEEIRLGTGTRLRVELTEPITVTVPSDED